MTHYQALQLLQPALPDAPQTWGDLGAGTGLFTEVLCDHLPLGSAVYALDKSPHMLWQLQPDGEVPFYILDADFTRSMPELPVCDGLLMANALHYVADPATLLPQVLKHLKPGGTFLLIEYEVHQPVGPYIPYPIPFARWQEICQAVGLSEPTLTQQVPSQYGHDHIYAAVSQVQ